MSVDLISPPPNLTKEETLYLSQQAPHILQPSIAATLPWPLSVLFGNETQDTWGTYENVYLACLRTGDDKSARLLLDRLVARFGESNERVMAFKGMWAESKAETEQDCIKVLDEYKAELEKEPTNFPVQKRRIALLKSMGRIPEAITQLVEFLNSSPTDGEAWSELAELYVSQSDFERAIFCLEEIILILPHAWNVHARLAEVTFLYGQSIFSSNPGEAIRAMAESMRRYCRSIELCDNYLRGYYGLKLVTKRLLEVLPSAPKSASNTTDSAFSDLPLPSVQIVERLNEKSTERLANIVRRNAAAERGWDGYDRAEVIAARELLNREEKHVER
ncbi:tetratricopeptide repeat domain-containing protein [Trichodelitschia bisporula]|uniref:ER membrane protein complex subunit 2 n=1 Tax=Trichodelitschia bisporula TaxID=703511 RepID=A0A6G1IBB9_9PEZI|nr:tetratricopeptide repeat domain-containing protein [Trichodelitschia bisporula]